MGALMRRSFTLFEMVMVIVITAILAVASYKAITLLIVKSFKARELTRLSLESQIALDQISSLLAYRIPAATIGYDPQSGDFAYIGSIIDSSNKYRVLEWLSIAFDDYRGGGFSGFIDMKRSIATHNILYSDVHMPNKECNLIFAGRFDKGFSLVKDFKEAFGWHGFGSRESFDVAFIPEGLQITDRDLPKVIYEKYYLVDQAFAIARAADVDRGAACLKGLEVDDDTLLLFFGYKPWKKESFCADPHSMQRGGGATILLRHVTGFSVKEQDYTIRIMVDIRRAIKGTKPLHFAKMKVVF